MSADLRDLIRSNRIRDAFAAIDRLHPTGEIHNRLIGLERRWQVIQDQALSQTEQDSVLRVEENKVVEDLIRLVDRIESQPTTPETPPTPPPTATTITTPVSGTPPAGPSRRWPLALAGVLLLALVAYVQFRPQEPAGPAEATNERPTENTAPAPRRPVAGPEPSPTTSESAGQPATRDPSPFMTAGREVDVALAVYTSDGGETTYNPAQTGRILAYLSGQLRGVTLADGVLTDVFHDSEVRRELLRSATGKTDERLRPERAQYVFLVDARLDGNGRADLRTCLYDTATRRGINRNERVGRRLLGTPLNLFRDLPATVLDVLKEHRTAGRFNP